MGEHGEARIKVLVVDDDATVRQFVFRALGTKRFELYGAENGNEALAFMEAERGAIALLITDVVMPGCNGRTLATKLRDAWPELRVIFMSGSARAVAARHGIGEHDDFLNKPFTPQSLREHVDRALTGGAT